MSKYLNLIILILVLSLLSISVTGNMYDTITPPMVYGEVSFLNGIFEQGQDIVLIQNCIGGSYANLTRITYPNSSIILDGQYAMTKLGDNYNYTFLNTSIIGYYSVYGECDYTDVGGNLRNSTWAYSFKVTNDGIEDTPQDSTSSISLMLFMLFIIIGLFMLGFFGEFNKFEIVNLVIKRGCFVAAIMLMMYTTTILLEIVSYANQDLLGKEMVFLMVWIGWAGYVATVFLVIMTLFDILRLKKEGKEKKVMEMPS